MDGISCKFEPCLHYYGTALVLLRIAASDQRRRWLYRKRVDSCANFWVVVEDASCEAACGCYRDSIGLACSPRNIKPGCTQLLEVPIQDTAMVDRRRAATALTLVEREEISRAIVAGESIRSIAARLGRAPSTISREIKRNGDRGAYRASQAEEAAWDRARRPKRCKLTKNRALARIVAEKLRML